MNTFVLPFKREELVASLYGLDLSDKSWYLASVKIVPYSQGVYYGVSSTLKLIPLDECDEAEVYHDASKDIKAELQPRPRSC